MPIMTWDGSLDVGVPAMNREHQDILDAMNRIYDARERGIAGESVNRMVAELGDICSRHFADEERYMASIQYPGLSTHKLLHADLLRKFGQHAEEIRAANGKPSEEFFKFLKFWLTSHIKGIDVKYGAHAAAA